MIWVSYVRISLFRGVTILLSLCIHALRVWFTQIQYSYIPGVVLKHKNVSSIEEYNIGDRLKYSRIKQSSKKDIEESRINVKYQEHYRSIWNSAKCKMQSAKYNVQSAKYKVQSAKCKVQYRNFWNNAKY